MPNAAILQPAAIAKRARAIRLSQEELARRSGRAAVTITRVLTGKTGTRATTLELLTAVVVEEEKRMFRHLRRLYA